MLNLTSLKDFNDTFFNQYLDAFNLLYGNECGAEFIATVKGFGNDNKLYYKAVTDDFLKLIRIPKTKKMILDKIDEKLAIVCSTSEKHSDIVTKLKSIDQSTLNNKTINSFLYITLDSYAYVVRKSPIVNPQTGNSLGVLSQYSKFLMPDILRLSYKMNGVKFNLANDESEQQEVRKLSYPLTEKQHMVLFLYVNRYSYSEISAIMTHLGHKISPGRVNDHLENLKYMFMAKNKEKLLENAIAQDYHLFVPRKFINAGIVEINEEMLISDK